ncbi:hypothetical protein RRG08_010194 [Elysia crispata]|uniref:Uncharacterized protein n=1 Tax=Elysia crispata TaxID=231223 RepID=A0AAE1AJB8_9GAST|nr:hypothetical protein RRG08_010194 [Elysia crispata]
MGLFSLLLAPTRSQCVCPGKPVVIIASNTIIVSNPAGCFSQKHPFFFSSLCWRRPYQWPRHKFLLSSVTS